jgi:hypothetical protein
MSHDWRERGAVDIGRLDEHQGNGEYRRTRWTSPAWASCRRCGVSRVAAEHFGWECAATEQREVEQRTLAANGVSGQPAAAAPGLVAARTTEVLLREAAAALRVERLERDADRYAKRLRGHQIACCDHRCTYCNAPLPKVRCTNCDSYEPAPPAAAPGLVGELDELAAILRREGNPDFALIAEAAAAALRAASAEPSDLTANKAEAYDAIMRAFEVVLDGDTMYAECPSELVYRLRSRYEDVGSASAEPEPRCPDSCGPMEAQWVCEQCGHREPMPDLAAAPPDTGREDEHG